MERLQNILAKAGVASRRASAAMIEAGRVMADGIVILAPGERFDPSNCQIAVDGKPIPAMERKRTIMMYKPAGVLSTASDPFGGKTVVDIIRGKIPERLVPVGRLDKDSEGLILLSNDGDLALRLTHPRYGHEKTYIVKVAGRWSEEKLAALRSPAEMPDGYVTKGAKVRLLRAEANNTAVLEFKLGEGRKRQIRYTCSAAHLTVLSLKRIAIGRLYPPKEMKSGEWRDLSPEEIALLA